MKIVILADSIDNQNAGVHFFTKNLILALLKIDPKNEYIFIHQRKNSFFRGLKHHIISIKKFPGAQSFRRFFLIPRLAEKLKADIVIEPCHIGPLNISSPTKRVTIIHDLTPILFPKLHIFRSSIIHKLLLGRVLKKTDLILTPSDQTAKDIRKIYNPQAPIKVISAGIPDPTPTKRNSPFPQPYILYLGTIEPRKNLMPLIESFVELKKELQIPHKLVLAGGLGWHYKNILQKAAKNPNIILPGYIEEQDKPSLYANADFFVYPSIYEGFGLPPLEAMSYGIPVISSTGGSLKDVLGDNALLFDPKDKKTLKSHMENLINNPRLKKDLAQKGHDHVKQYTWEKTAKRVIEAIEKI
ncbi:glycosyltransferase family 4 protein [Patescibacteria group bacterium]|nr:glycosyltransferase family 4 protein [Patescibacteria group bacterium]